jgi:hypothetical protein
MGQTTERHQLQDEANEPSERSLAVTDRGFRARTTLMFAAILPRVWPRQPSIKGL